MVLVLLGRADVLAKIKAVTRSGAAKAYMLGETLSTHRKPHEHELRWRGIQQTLQHAIQG